MTQLGDALLLGGFAVLVGSAVFLLSARLGGDVPITPRTSRRLARKVQVTRFVLLASVAVVYAGWWLAT